MKTLYEEINQKIVFLFTYFKGHIKIITLIFWFMLFIYFR